MEGTGHPCPLCSTGENKTLSQPGFPIDPPKEQVGRFLMKLMLENFTLMCISVLIHLKLTKPCTSVC